MYAPSCDFRGRWDKHPTLHNYTNAMAQPFTNFTRVLVLSQGSDIIQLGSSDWRSLVTSSSVSLLKAFFPPGLYGYASCNLLTLKNVITFSIQANIIFTTFFVVVVWSYCDVAYILCLCHIYEIERKMQILKTKTDTDASFLQHMLLITKVGLF